MSWLLALPLIIPFATAVFVFLLRKNTAAGRWLSVAGCALLLITSIALMAATWREGVVAAQMGGWPAPFGITLVADLLSAVMVLITAITGLAVAVYALADIDARREALGYHALFQILLAGVCGAFLTGDIFNLYVWFEVMLIASFGLLVLGGDKAQLDGGIKYVTINLVSTVMFLTGIALLYGLTGTLNMADLHGAVRTVENQGLLSVVAVIFMIAFGVKAAVFPLFFWLPASYHTPPVAVSAVFAGLLTKVGVYALIRTFTLIFNQDIEYTHNILLVVAALTMITGVLGAAAQNEFRKILSFHIVSQIGYMILGLALFTPLALVGTVFYLVHHIIVKANLFLVSGVARRLTGSFELSAVGGLYKSSPLLAVLFLIPAFSLAGFPPLSGFWAKFLLVKASLEIEAYLIAAIALVVGLLTIFSMTKIWAEVFWKPHPEEISPVLSAIDGRARLALMAPVFALAVLTVIIGFFPEPFIIFAERSAAQLLDPAVYVRAVLGGGSMNIFILNAFLAVSWSALIGSFTLTNLLIGYVIGYAALWVARPLFKASNYFERVWRVLRLILLFIYELVISSFRVVWDVVTPTHLSRPGIIAVPLDAETDEEILLVANLISLTPGSLSLDVSPDRKTLYVHAMFVDDPETLRQEIKQGLERSVIEALR